MKFKEKIIFIIAALSLFVWILYLAKPILMPFICSLVVAYFLDPLVDFLQKKYGLSRLNATTAIMGGFFLLLILLGMALVPVIYVQLHSLIEALPDYAASTIGVLYPKIVMIANKMGINFESNFSNFAEKQGLSETALNFLNNVLNNTLSSSITIINILSLVFITPVLVFYFLKDWDILVERIDNYLPQAASMQIRKVAKDIDKTLSGYVRGQFNVCCILVILYSSLLSLTGINFGFLIGCLTGLFAFIPYVGLIGGIVVAVIVSLFQWGWDFSNIAAVLMVFIFGHLLESNFLTPKLIGKKIGLHPVWIIFGLFFFGVIFGFIGVLIAIPLTAACGVIAKHFALEYKKRFA